MLARLGLVLAALLVVPAAGPADEAVRRDGTRVSGRLTLTPAGRFAFRGPDRDEPVADLDLVRFASKPPLAPAVPLWHQVRLAHGEVLLGEVLKVDANDLHVRTAWTERLDVPRPAVERVTNTPGWRPVFVGRDPAAEVTLKPPLAAGRVGVGFRTKRTTARRLALELQFARDDTPATVRIELLGPGERYAVESPAKAQHDGRLKRDPGPRRLSVEFDRDRLHVFVDDQVLWAQAAGPGDLHTIKLVVGGDGAETVGVDDIHVFRPEPAVAPHSWADLTADAVRSPDGDETFGALSAAGPAGVTLETKGAKRRIGWPDAAEFAFRRGPVAERATTGEHVQVRVRTADESRDVLDGAVKSLDEKALVLAHAVLGDLTIPRDRLEELRLRFFGRRVPVDATPRHLGNRPAFGFAVPKPGGLQFGRRLTVDAAAGGSVVVDAAHVSGKGAPVEVSVNGKAIGDLNRQADRSEATVRAYRLPLPMLRSGEVEVEVRLRPPEDGRRVTGVDLRAVRLELHDRR